MSIDKFSSLSIPCSSKDIERWTTILTSIHCFLHNNPTGEKKDNDIQLISKEITNIWLDKIESTLSIENQDTKKSTTDILFIIMCYVKCVQNLQIRNLYYHDNLADIITTVMILGSRHDIVRQKKEQCPYINITYESITSILDRIASFVTRYNSIDISLLEKNLPFQYPKNNIEKELKTILELDHLVKYKKENQNIQVEKEYGEEEDEEEKLLIQHLKDESHKSHIISSMDSQHIIKITEQDAEQDDMGGNRGEYWLLYKESIIRRYIPLCSHILHAALLELKILDGYEIILSSNITTWPINYNNSRKRFDIWLQKRSNVDTNDNFGPRFRKLAQERMLPLGSRSKRYRREATMFNNDEPMEILQDQLGYHISSRLHDMFYYDRKKIASETDHPIYDSLCLFMLSYIIEHESELPSFSFWNHFYISASDIHNIKKLELLKQKELYGYIRLPIIIDILNKIYVHTWYSVPGITNTIYESNKNGVIYECKDMIDAILVFLMLISRDHQNILKLEQDIKFHTWTKRFFKSGDFTIDDD